ncbi:MAG: amino acid ABC transporter substrate-binding protein, partial [Deltaproteobacteria bacterium]|nr:amino acid ABC transporter substrate-binding protein [Deltaproteobacteria bacterium]
MRTSSKLTIGLSLSLSGRYAAMGCQAESALRLFAADINAAGGVEIGGQRHDITLECADDRGDQRCAESIYRQLSSSHQVNLLFSPYGSALTRTAAPIAEAAGLLFVNHGGADDGLYQHAYRMLVGVLTPASGYMTELARLVSGLKFWRKRIAMVSAASPFARAVAEGMERTCAERLIRRRGVRVRVKYRGRFDPEHNGERLYRALRRNRINILFSAGSYEHDVAVMRFATSEQLYIPVLGCVAAGVNSFCGDLGVGAEGIVGPAQWDPLIEVHSALGLSTQEFVARFRASNRNEPDYPAAQAYAAGLLTMAAIRAAGSLDPARIRAAFSDLRTTTFFGDFAIEPGSGRQIGHKMLLVQWHAGRKVIIHPEPDLHSGELEFPSGWRLLLASLQTLRMKRRNSHEDNA